MTKPISSFEVIDCDPETTILDLGTLTYDGVRMDVELHAFAGDDEKPFIYDFRSADIMLIRKDGTTSAQWRNLLDETYATDGLVSALQEFMAANVEGESNVCWGESGAQNSDNLAFGRNGW